MTNFAVLFLLVGACLHVAFAQRFPVINDGNNVAPIAHLHYLASLQLATTEEEFFCTGVFISRRAVLTLATCFYRNDVLLDPEDVRIVAGSSFRLDSEKNTFTGLLERILVHENFSRSSLENNLALGFISTEVHDNNIDALTIFDISTESPAVGAKCDIYGWSLTTSTDVPHLLSGEVVIEDSKKCDVLTNKITSTTICAGPYFVNGCETDDGSPLVCDRKLHGLIDYRPIGYCKETIFERLGTYVDLSEFREWIVDHSSSAKIAMNSLLWLTALILINFLT